MEKALQTLGFVVLILWGSELLLKIVIILCERASSFLGWLAEKLDRIKSPKIARHFWENPDVSSLDTPLENRVQPKSVCEEPAAVLCNDWSQVTCEKCLKRGGE